MGNIILFPAPPPSYTASDVEIKNRLVWIDHGEGEQPFPCLWYSHESPHTIIYFHGNSVDLGEIVDEMYMLHQLIPCNILALEFPGYGLVASMDINPSKIDVWGLAAFDWLTQHGIQPLSILSMGRSIGTGPAAKLAATLKQQGISLGGVILHCPYISIHKIVSDYTQLGTWIINNYWDTEESLSCLGMSTPLLIIHGLNDEIIPVNHGQTLFSRYRGSPEIKTGFFPEDSPHNNYSMINDIVSPIKTFVQTKALSRWNTPSTIHPGPRDRSWPSREPQLGTTHSVQTTAKAVVHKTQPTHLIEDKQTKKSISAIKSFHDIQ